MYVFRTADGTTYDQVSVLTVAGMTYDDGFGTEVAVAGNVVVVASNDGVYVFRERDAGAGGHDLVATLLTGVTAMAVDGDGATIAVGNDEAVKVFRTTDGWDTHTEIEITAADGEAYDYFGDSVAIDGTTVVVGAYWTYYRGKKGAAYVFRLTDDGYEEVATLTASDGAEDDKFGRSVAVDGDSIVVGAEGVNSAQGAAYVFYTRDGGDTYEQTDKLMGQYEFGAAVAMDGGSFVVGAPGGYNWDAGSATIFGPPADGSDDAAGQAPPRLRGPFSSSSPPPPSAPCFSAGCAQIPGPRWPRARGHAAAGHRA